MGVSAIIPNWNRADLLQTLLPNLRAQTMPVDQIIVADNGSTDGSREVAKEFGAEVVALNANRGFAMAVNAGIAKATEEWLLILNNDVTLAADWLEVLTASAQRSGVTFAAGKLMQEGGDGMIDGSWDLVSRGAYAWRCGFGRPDGPVWSERRRISFAPMTAALFHKSVFDQVGLLETRFESYYEDVDFGIRCAMAGIEGVYEPAAVATHVGKSTFGKASYRVMYLSARNQVLLLAKHYPNKTLLRFAWAIFVGQFLAIVAGAKHGQASAVIQGKLAGLRQWRAFRQAVAGAETRAIEDTFARSERDILSLQRQIGFDPYWRMYFRLLGSQ